MGCVLSCCGRSDVVSATATSPASSPTVLSPLLSPVPSKSQASALVFDVSSPVTDDEIATTSAPPPAMPVPIARKGQESSGGPAPVAPGKPRPAGFWPQEQQQQQ
ncbi:hypothetical protein LTR17_001955 [Elasticomyces elasticus]|nr:hypothetical protein LTR17_001955 [Elasticomyces elasticus]